MIVAHEKVFIVFRCTILFWQFMVSKSKLTNMSEYVNLNRQVS